jgi:membrane dipeptidase
MSYEYLKKENVLPVKLCKEIGRIEESIVELNPDDEERAIRLHQESIVIDFHNHLYVLPENMEDLNIYSRIGRPTTGYEGIKKSGMTACLCGFSGMTARRLSPVPWQFEDAVWDIGMRQADIDHHRDVVMRGYCKKDILDAKRSGRTAIIPHIENAGIIGNDIDRLDVLYGLGIRCMGLTYNTNNFIGAGLKDRNDSGLSKFGIKVVERMNRLGMLIDFSHSSEQSIREGVEASERPCCCTHMVAKALENNPRGLSDELFELLAKHDAVIGLEAVPNITSFKDVQSVFDVIDHVDYLVKLIGIDHVAIGTDAMFADHVAFHKAMLEAMGMAGMTKNFPATHIEYIENPSQLPNVTRALVARGYKDDEIEKIIGGNILRLLEQTIG